MERSRLVLAASSSAAHFCFSSFSRSWMNAFISSSCFFSSSPVRVWPLRPTSKVTAPSFRSRYILGLFHACLDAFFLIHPAALILVLHA